MNSGAIQNVTADGVYFNNAGTYTAAAGSTGAYAGASFQFLADLPAAFVAPFNFIQVLGGGPTLTITGFNSTIITGIGGIPNVAVYTNITGYANNGVVSHPFDPTTGFNVSLGASGSGQFDVVPSPALLPGLLGMGLAAWRRRKQEAMEESEV